MGRLGEIWGDLGEIWADMGEIWGRYRGFHGLADQLLPHHRRERERELGVLLAERHAEELAHEGEGLELRRREGRGRGHPRLLPARGAVHLGRVDVREACVD